MPGYYGETGPKEGTGLKPEYGHEAEQAGSPMATAGREPPGRKEYRTLLAP